MYIQAEPGRSRFQKEIVRDVSNKEDLVTTKPLSVLSVLVAR